MQDKKETHLYTCKYCKIEFKPTRRRVQKFCSDNCRSKNWFMIHSKDSPSPIAIKSNETKVLLKTKKKKKKKKGKKKKEKKSRQPTAFEAFFTSTAGTYVGNKIDRATIKEENRPLTKGDMMNILSNIQRFQKVNNLPLNELGQQPYIDIATGNIEYIGEKKSFLDI